MSTQKRFAVFDIDGTLVRWQLYHALVDNLVKAKLIDESIFSDVKQARMEWKKRAHVEAYDQYEDVLVQTFLKELPNITPEQFTLAAQETFEEYKDQVYTFTRELVKFLKTQGYTVLAISGSQKEIVSMIAEHYGFDDCVGSELEQKNGKFTGKAISPFGKKDQILKSLIKKHKLGLQGSVAVGDSESDIAMLKMVEQPIVFNPTSGLFKTAKDNNWRIVIERKNVVYKLEPNAEDKDGTYRLA